jgi:hypothetical protein
MERDASLLFRLRIELSTLIPTNRKRVVPPEYFGDVPDVMVGFLFGSDSSEPCRADSISGISDDMAVDCDDRASNLLFANPDDNPIKTVELILGDGLERLARKAELGCCFNLIERRARHLVSRR